MECVMRWSLILISALVGLLTMTWCVPSASAAGDAVADAKRKAAQQLAFDGKDKEAISILSEVTAGGGGTFKDYQMLGRLYDKTNQATQAVAAYRKVLELADSSKSVDERAARVEAERKVKTQDTFTEKLDTAEQEFLKKLDGMEKEADAAKNSAAVEKIWRLRGNLIRGEGRDDRSYFEVAAQPLWVPTGFNVIAGHRYVCRTHGTWRTGAGPETECSALGFKGANNGTLPLGCLGVNIDNRERLNAADPAGFKPTVSGPLFFYMNVGVDYAKSSGMIQVIIERKD